MSVTKLFRLSNTKLTNGEVGIEIEVEGSRLPDSITGWRRENDGSLRGESAEYVLKKPIQRKSIKEYLDRITNAYAETDAVISDTDRAGVHIHINVQDMQFHQVMTFVCLYLIFEDMLVRFCGDKRVGNLFCLRLRDAEGLLDYLSKAISSRNLRMLATDKIRYASVNLLALHNYGSVEFRALRTTTDMSLIHEWANMLLGLKDLSAKFEHPRDLVEKFSELGPNGMFDLAFLGYKSKLKYNGYDTDMWQNIRNVQDIAYCTDWNDWIKWEYEVDNPINPFSNPEYNTQAIPEPVSMTRRTTTLRTIRVDAPTPFDISLAAASANTTFTTDVNPEDIDI